VPLEGLYGSLREMRSIALAAAERTKPSPSFFDASVRAGIALFAAGPIPSLDGGLPYPHPRKSLHRQDSGQGTWEIGLWLGLASD
jgi:hypothetical protein